MSGMYVRGKFSLIRIIDITKKHEQGLIRNTFTQCTDVAVQYVGFKFTNIGVSDVVVYKTALDIICL